MRIRGVSAAFLLTICLPLLGQTTPSFEINEASVTNAAIETSRCNTKVNWIADNDQAFAEAKRTGKPVYMLHLSGNLKNESFT